MVLLADRGFVHTDLMPRLTTQLGWNYRIRLKSNSWIWRGGKGWCQLKDYHLNRGQRCDPAPSQGARERAPREAICLHNLRLHKGAYYGLVDVIIGRNNVNGEFWAIVSDEPTSLKTFEEYGLRFDIEENFWDDHSSGWNIQKSEPRDVCPKGYRSAYALSRLWLILAVATLYVTAQGVAVVESGNRRRVDTHWFGGNSYFLRA